MKTHWKKFAMSSALASEDEMSRTHLKENLKGWFFEYMDAGLLDEFFEDLAELANEELTYFEKRMGTYKEAIKRLSKK